MKINKLSIILALVALAVSTLACGFSTANIGDAWLSTDAEGNNRTTTFSQSDTMNLFVDLRNAPDDTELKVAWIAVNAEGVDPNYLLNETNYTSSDDTVHFDLSNDNLWPVGTYKADIYLNGTLDRSLSFEVQ
ncbi:hypothetical protein ANAEL_00190 [Anaerolineales bacterium]|nr:hypothetical protein ANAEL_00190 [Anaerolineales bacterium]